MRSSFCSWVCLRSDRSRVGLKAYRDHLLKEVSVLFGPILVRTRVRRCILTCPNEPHQDGKPTLVRFNQTKWGRCESTLNQYFEKFLWDCNFTNSMSDSALPRLPFSRDANFVLACCFLSSHTQNLRTLSLLSRQLKKNWIELFFVVRGD